LLPTFVVGLGPGWVVRLVVLAYTYNIGYWGCGVKAYFCLFAKPYICLLGVALSGHQPIDDVFMHCAQVAGPARGQVEQQLVHFGGGVCEGDHVIPTFVGGGGVGLLAPHTYNIGQGVP
jgi:hypothetical protein